MVTQSTSCTRSEHTPTANKVCSSVKSLLCTDFIVHTMHTRKAHADGLLQCTISKLAVDKQDQATRRQLSWSQCELLHRECGRRHTCLWETLLQRIYQPTRLQLRNLDLWECQRVGFELWLTAEAISYLSNCFCTSSTCCSQCRAPCSMCRKHSCRMHRHSTAST